MPTTTSPSSNDPEGRAQRREHGKQVSIWERIPRWISVTGFLVVLIVVWQILFSLQIWSDLIVPSPMQVGQELVSVVTNLGTGGFLWQHLGLTLTEIVVGYVIAVVVGFSLGLLVAETAFGRAVLMPYMIAFNAMPKIAFAPLFVGWFGFGISSKIAVVVFVAFFPLLINTAAGMASTDRDESNLFRALLASDRQTLFMLKIPNALPFIFAGLKTSAVLAVIGAIVGEFIGAAGGLGQLIRVAGSQLEIARLFAYVLLLGGIGSVLFQLISWLETKVVFWHRSDGFVTNV